MCHGDVLYGRVNKAYKFKMSASEVKGLLGIQEQDLSQQVPGRDVDGTGQGQRDRLWHMRHECDEPARKQENWSEKQRPWVCVNVRKLGSNKPHELGGPK